MTKFSSSGGMTDDELLNLDALAILTWKTFFLTADFLPTGHYPPQTNEV